MAKGEIFRQIAQKRPASNSFDMSYDHKLSLKMGNLYPVHLAECLPGDRWNMSASCMLRMAPMIAPIMHKVKVDLHFFFVPNRLLWSDWATFITGDDPFGTPQAFPYLSTLNVTESTLADYMGLPTGVALPNVSAMPFAAYQAIYTDYYRSQNVIAPVDYRLSDGDNLANYGTALGVMRKRAWMHDYFTSAQPWAQKGDPVELPLGDVIFKTGTTDPPLIVDAAGLPLSGALEADTSPAGELRVPVDVPAWFDPNGTLTTSAVTINDLRRAEALQVWLEANARGGTRYTESIKMHFDVNSPDARLQRPEFIGGISNPVVISEVLQTSSTDPADPTITPQGNMSGHGISAGTGRGMSYFCQEHGYIMGILSVLPVTAYQQGVPRHFSKFDKFLYGWPELAHLGEQEILKKEIYVAADGENDETFGYAPRYSEYKYQDNRVSGAFRSSLDFWHMGRKFSARPELNEAFISADPTTRIFAVELQDVDNMYAHVFFNMNARRMLPRFGIPSIQ